MSLEAAIANNTAAIRDLISVIQAGIALQPPQAAAAVANQAIQAAKTGATQATPTAQSPAPQVQEAALTRDDMAALITSLGQRDAPTMRALMKEFGAARLGDVPPEKYPALRDAINAKLEALAP